MSSQPELLDAYPLSPMQQGMLFDSLYAPTDGVYIEQRWCTLEGELDGAAFKQAWQQVVDRHAVLRSDYHWQDMEQPLQAVYANAQLAWHEEDWRALRDAEREQRLQEFLTLDRGRGFAMDQGPLMRLALFRIEDQAHCFVWTYHHLLMDGWCNGILIGEVLTSYSALRAGVAATLPPAGEYRAYIDWLQQRDAQAERDYWREELAGIEEPAVLNPGSCPGEPGYTTFEQKLDARLSETLVSFASEHRLTLNTLFQGALAIVLSRYADTDDVLFGATISGRPPELEGVTSLLGLFINTVPVRVATRPEQSLLDWLNALQQSQRAREAHGYALLSELQALTGVPAGTPMFDTLLVFENYPVSLDAALRSQDVGLTLRDADGYERTSFPLTLVVIPGEETHISARFATERFSPQQVERLCRHLQCVLKALVAPASTKLADISMLDDAEQQQLAAWGQGPVVAPDPRPVQQRFFEQARQRAGHAACHVRLPGSETRVSHSYAQLAAQVQQLARHLVAQFDLGPGQRVGILLERDEKLPVALLGVLAAGAGYVPLDRTYPEERLRFVIADARLDLIIHAADDRFLAELTAGSIPGFDMTGGIATPVADVELPAVTGSDIAYMIYTSGSTGLPKGVPVTHAGLGNFLDAMSESPGLSSDDVLLAVTTIAFDISVLELLLPLTRGAAVVIAGADEARAGGALAGLLEDYQITVMQASPATWRLLLNSGWAGNSHLRMLCGGEALEGALARELAPRCGELWNMYGPTETTIWSAAVRIDESLADEAQCAIGAAVNNTRLAVVDRHGRSLPCGAVGELLIHGDGLSPGYWQRSKLTAQRFIQRNGARWYRTGDLVRWRTDGLLDFLGRRDLQVKLRGHRIELGEIEAALHGIDSIRQAAVALVPAKGDDPQLVAFIVAAGQQDVDAIREQLRATLPAYMLPARFQFLDELPLTLNGKLNRKGLEACLDEVETDRARADSPQLELVRSAWQEVLGVGVVGDDDSFFDLGGHSLTATRLVTRLQVLLGIDVPLRMLFEQPRLMAFVSTIENRSGTASPSTPIPRVRRDEGALPLSPAQRRQWLLAGLYADSPLYGIPTAVRITGPVSVSALAWSLQQLTQRHEILRTAFVDQHGEPVALDADVAAPAVQQVTLQGDGELEPWLRGEATRAFDLAQAPLWRVGLASLNDGSHVLAVTLHHILADGWSVGVLVSELAALYSSQVSQGAVEVALPELPIQYADYAAWISDIDCAADLDYWQQQLAGLPPLLELPTDYARPAEQDPAGATHRFRVAAATRDALQAIGVAQGSTLFMTLLAAFAVLLQRLSGQADIAIGTPVANRGHPQVEGLIGLFVNTLVLRLDLGRDPTFAELLADTRAATLDAYQHQQAPFEQVLERLDVPRSRSHTPLFQVLFTLQNAPLESSVVPDLDWTALPLDSGTAKFDLSLAIREDADGLSAEFEYRTDLFAPETIARFSALYRQCLVALQDAVDYRVSQLPLLDPTMLADLHAFQRSPVDKPAPHLPIHALFTEQALQSADATALVQGGAVMSYRELDVRSNRLAHLLRKRGVSLETPVGVWSTRSMDTICALLAILKAGGLYVPLDPGTAILRQQQLLEDAGITTVVTACGTDVEAALAHITWLAIDAEAESLASQHADAPATELSADNLAYLVFTSGSTGRPKGVCVPHRAVTRLVRQSAFAEFRASDVFLQAAPLTFDASTLEIWGPLLNGGQLVLPPAEPGPLTLETIGDLAQRHAVTTLWLTAGLFHLVIDKSPGTLASVRQLLAGGDVLSVDHLRRARAALPHTRLINGYGPTENTTFTCCHTFTDEELSSAVGMHSAPIGRPVGYTTAYILDACMEPAPIGVPGELYVSGQGLARGYLNHPDLTAERFVPNPFFDPRGDAAIDAAHTLYRTGDRVRWRADGVMEFLGRVDRQAKIRGFRVEPGEIERALKEHPQIATAVVTVIGERADSKHLAAYLIAEPGGSAGGSAPNAIELRRFLLQRLPPQLIPAVYTWLPDLPLNDNGKVDRAALPEPVWDRAEDDDAPAQNERERIFLAIWSGLLPGGPVGRHSNFFELGGDSIIALQIVSRAAHHGLSITPLQLFQYQTVAELAAAAADTAAGSGAVVPATGEVELTPIQRWYLARQPAQPDHFNQALAIRLPADIDRQRLAHAFARVTGWHDGLRLRFEPDNQGCWTQRYAEHAAPIELSWRALDKLSAGARNAAIAQHVAELHTGLSLASGPLLRAMAFSRGDEGGNLLVLVAHHLVIDGVSWRLLLDDLYQAYLDPEAPAPPATASIKAWSRALRAALPAAEDERVYWQSVVNAAVTAIPGARAAESRYADVSSHRVSLDAAESADLLQGNTHLLLLAALAQTLRDWNGGNMPTLALESHGRDGSALGIDLDVSRTLGWFTAIYPFTPELGDGDGPAARLETLSGCLEQVPSNGLGYGILRYLGGHAELAVRPAVSFNYLGALDPADDLSAAFQREAAPGPLQAGDQVVAHQLAVNAWFEAGQLCVEWLADHRVHSSQTVAGLADTMLLHLREFQEAALNIAAANPFAQAGLDDAELAAVLAQVDFGSSD